MSTRCPLSLISKIIEVADICCHGRVVSVLEGGYGRTPKRESERLSSNSNVNSKSNDILLDKAVFSESVMRHLRALIDPYGMHITFLFFFFFF
jgi:acetoin utilization deacetylase AcuC-like enzyme